MSDGSPACPFVAFEDDRDARADRPDHRHRCFAEGEPAPRALAHQEAYCLSSAFPVCPTFQAWARREAAKAKPGAAPAGATVTESGATAAASDRSAARSTDEAGPSSGPDLAPPAAAAALAASADHSDGAGDLERVSPDGRADEWASAPTGGEPPIESTPRRNPPRDWAAPPPWATGGAGSSGYGARSGGGSASRDATGDAPGFLGPRPGEGAGLAGSAADRLASGESIADAVPPVAPATPSAARRPTDLPSAGPDPELAGLVGGVAAASAAARAAAPMSEEDRVAAGYPPSTRGGRRPSVSSTRTERERAATPRREPVQHAGPAGPSWEHARRYEAYPAIKTSRGLPSIGGLPRIAVLAGALGIAAIALFFLPALLGVGGGGGGSPSAAPSASSVVATPTPEPTPEPAPTPQVYVIKANDTLSKIAKNNGITLDQLLAANKDTIKNPNKIKIGDKIIIPVPVPEEVSGGSPAVSTAP